MSEPATIPNITGDLIAGGAIVSTLLGYLPAAAAIVGIVWYAIQIWESATAQNWWRRRQERVKRIKITRLQAKQKLILAQLDALELVRVAKTVAAEKVESARAEAAADKVVGETTAAIAATKLPS